jgi:hypothetical protein
VSDESYMVTFFYVCGLDTRVPYLEAAGCFCGVHIQQLVEAVERAGVGEALAAAYALGSFSAVRDFVRGGGLPGACVDRYGVVVWDPSGSTDVQHAGAA